MTSIIFSLIFIFLTNLLIEPTACTLSTYLQNRELDDITSLQHESLSIIGKVKFIVNQLHCPKGWRRLGGSCYYLSHISSIPAEANHTCNQLHSNLSNLMQIRNTVELFYAVHVINKNNLSALMVEINLNLLKGKTITEILMDDQDRWQRMKDKFRKVRIRDNKLKEKILDELNSAGLRISIRSKKIKQSIKKQKQKFIHDYKNQTMTNYIFSNSTTKVDRYEYENLDFEDEIDDFERMEDIRGICDHIDWNVIHNNATVYMLTTFLRSDKIVCSLSNVVPNLEYKHVCEYVLDYCFANIDCGKHGHCVNTLSGFKCSCSFLYDGLLCEKISKQGKQIIICLILILVLYGLSIKPIRWTLFTVIKRCMLLCKYRRRIRKHKENNNEVASQELVPIKKIDNDPEARTSTIDQENMEFIRKIYPGITCNLLISFFSLPRNHQSIENPNKRDLIRLFWVGGLSIFYLTLLLSITTIPHFKYDIVNETKLDSLINDTRRLVVKCRSLSYYTMKNYVFLPIAFALVLIFSWSIKREKRCLHMCDGRPGLIPSIEPFRTGNRFTTAAVFGILAFEFLKIFEEFLFDIDDSLNHGLLIKLLNGIIILLLFGFRYYPVLASLQLRNIAARFFVCLYIFGDIIWTIIREGSCIGSLPLSRYHPIFEELILQIKFRTWLPIYGLIKTIPYFILLSYITAELCVRFAYDSIYVPIKKKQSLWSSPVAQPDESAFAKYYVTKLFRRNLRSNRTIYSIDVDIGNLDDFEYDAELQRKANQSCIKKFFNSIYHWDDDFRFTTMVICTYTVAIVSLYYLSCTLVFLYISRITSSISFIKYIETTFNIEFHGFFSLRLMIIISAGITVMIFIIHLLIGMRNYKRHKLQLFKGLYEDIPSAANFKLSTMVSKSVRYFGFLVGYMACGFIICFHLIFFIFIAIRIISLRIPNIELLLGTTITVLVAYLLVMLITSSIGKTLFIQYMGEGLYLTNRKSYGFLIYFTCFADFFLGIVSCIIRLIKATFINVIYMARLDCSLHGRPLEKFDSGYAVYVSYLHMEVAHTNPIMLAFCSSLYDDIIQRRPKHCYDDECCCVSGELHNDIQDEEQPQDKLKPMSNVSTAYSTIDHLVNSDKPCQRDKIIRQKRARFRWFLVYTIINNYCLFDLRKQVQTRLARLHIERSNSIDKQHVAAAAAAFQDPVMENELSESPESEQTKIKFTKSTTDISVPSEYQPAVAHGQLSSTESDVDDYDQSPAERYIAIRSSMLYDVNAQRADTRFLRDDNLQQSSDNSPSQNPHQIKTINKKQKNDKKRSKPISSSSDID